VKAIAEGLKHSQLRVLTLWRNEVGDEGCEALIKSLEHHPTLTTLDLHDAKINSRGVELLSSVINTGSIAWLSLSMNPIGDSGASHLARALSKVFF
jgi:Ran GTPase-activating protein (RanGAP) involved in mRNA processing and transport